jgi:predicted ATPase/DNA-binding CsgD family transcriptional regulator
MLEGSRMVTLTGPGGMGKTRLAIQVGLGATSRFPDGVWLVELAPLTDPALMPQIVAGVLPKLKDQPGAHSPEDIAAHIGEQSTLLVIDNCEHLLAPSSHFLDFLLRACPELSVLATSREPLGIGGEQRWAVGPLSVVDLNTADAASVKASDAGQLFVQRATACSPGFRLTKAIAPTVAEICVRLDGMPLAIELAAARLASLSPKDVLERLDDRFRLLRTSSRTVVPRHRSLAATLEWSYDLLSGPEAALLRRVSVFRGCSFEAAQDVCAGGDVEAAEIVDHLGVLADKSFLIVDTLDDRVRYRLLETIRAWASTKLDEAGEAEDVAGRHAAWCLELAENAEVQLNGSQPQPWLDRLGAENENLIGALAWARDTGEIELGVRLVTSMATCWRVRGELEEGLEWLEWALTVSEKCEIPLRAKALRWTGLLRGMLGDIPSALPLLEESSALFAEAGNHDASLCACNSVFHMFRNPRQSLPELQEQVERARQAGDINRLGQFSATLAQAHFSLGELSESRRRFDECVQLGRERRDGDALLSGLFGLGRVAGLLGEPDAAEAALTEARAHAEGMDDDYDVSMALGLLGDLARARGEWDRARKLHAESMRLTTTDESQDSQVSVARSVYFSARLAEAENLDGAGASELFEKALSLGRAADAPAFHEARCLLGAGSAALVNGQRGAAAGRLLEALEMAQAIGDAWTTAQALDHLGGVARLDGRAEEADGLARRGLELHHSIGDVAGTSGSLESVAALAVDGERWPVAARLLAAAQAQLDSVGYARSRPDQVRHEQCRDEVRTALGDDEFAAAWDEGLELSAEEAVTYAMRGRGSRDRPSSGWDSLTPAERQVVILVGEGLTNPEVGKRLFVSPRTVGHHLAHVYRKLNIHSRGALMKELADREPE